MRGIPRRLVRFSPRDFGPFGVICYVRLTSRRVLLRRPGPGDFMQTPEDVVGSSSANGSAVAPVIPQTTDHDVNGEAKVDAQGLADFLHVLQKVRAGDFSVRLPAT